jgi:hypothetical protein
MAGPLDVPMGYVPTDPRAEKKAEQLPQYFSQPGKIAKPAPPDANAHWLDEVLYDVMGDFNDSVEWVAGAFSEGTRAPFSANLSEDQKLDVFRDKLFTSDGKPNDAGRAELQAIYGPAGVASIMAEVMDKRARPFIIEPKDYYLHNGDEEAPRPGNPSAEPEPVEPPEPAEQRAPSY